METRIKRETFYRPCISEHVSNTILGSLTIAAIGDMSQGKRKRTNEPRSTLIVTSSRATSVDSGTEEATKTTSTPTRADKRARGAVIAVIVTRPVR